jgi:hypothetical protein
VSAFKFRYPAWRELEPSEWLHRWAEIYGEGDNPQYYDLMDKREKQGKLLGEDFEQVGRWKEGCLKPGHGSWKPRTPRAYDIWMQARSELPRCPERDTVAAFLKDWSERTFVAGKKKNGLDLRQKFGLSRATALLHFMSGGQYPIFDRRVAAAMSLLGSPVEETINGYLNGFCPLFGEIAAACGASQITGLRRLDNALFNYGLDLHLSKFDLSSG